VAGCLDNAGSSTAHNPIASTTCYGENFTFYCVLFVVCNVSFIVCVALCAVFCLSAVCYFA
jgi:hypothetical protein